MALVAALALTATAPVFAQRRHEGERHPPENRPSPSRPAAGQNQQRPQYNRREDRPAAQTANRSQENQNRAVESRVPRPPGEPRQGHAGSWLSQHRDLPPAQQKKALESSPDFRKLPPEKQEQLKQRLERFDNLPPQQQERIIQRMHTFQHLTPQQQQTVREFQRQMRNLPPGRREMVRTALGGLRQMPADQRREMLNSRRFQNMFTSQERKMLEDATQLPLAPASDEPGGGEGGTEEPK